MSVMLFIITEKLGYNQEFLNGGGGNYIFLVKYIDSESTYS